ncbi:hypothetical protein HGRIS_014226 [Hohenbuehelia grisea]|uniref:Epoxide hydrolase N-terminal domain-containing protein n=1 Tax=Hohenbuehelia grisea TaxID=104357 RepID=A0ABR3JSV3_9AGAR
MADAGIPFSISIPDAKIKQLKAKLDSTIFPDELDDAGWQYGAPLADVKRLVSHWKDAYDWRKHEAELNRELPQYTRAIDIEGQGTLDIHYIYKKSEVINAIPLLFVHGWPGSFIEARKILSLLVTASADQPSFHVVALSLPGYGFSEAPKKKGFGIQHYAEVGHKLMVALGYNEYITQGGDWGALVTRKIANDYGGRHVKAWHTNMPVFARAPDPLREPISYLAHLLKPYTAAEKAGLACSKWFDESGSGYYSEQSTQPQTLGYSLSDSPVGLLAWIYEKLVVWTDNYPWTDDEILTWISIYWFSRAGPAASLRIYYEIQQQGGFKFSVPAPKVPTGYSYFPRELGYVPLSWLKRDGNVVFHNEHRHGGHFAAFEQPRDLVADLRKMFGKHGPAFGVVSGRNGYT